MFPLPFGETAVRLRRRMIEDPYSGELTRSDWSNHDELEIEGAAVAPSSSTDQVGTSNTNTNRQLVITMMSVYGPTGMDVREDDRIRVRSGLWDVIGDKADWRNPFTGWEPGDEFPVKRVKG